MRFIHRKITIINIRKPVTNNVNQELQWFGTSLGLFNLRDRDKSCFRIFIELLKAAKSRRPLKSDDIAIRSHLSRGTVIHHINRLMESGIVVSDGKKYMLRVDNLKALISEVEKDIKRACDDLKDIASEIDDRLGLE